MHRKRLVPRLFASLAVALAIGWGLASGSGIAEAESASEDSATITTRLHPGWNLVGWVGPETPVADLFEELPALQQVSARDAEAGAWVQARPRSRSAAHGLRLLTPGMGLWFWIGGNETVEWTRPAGAESVLLQLHRGLNLAAWFGGPASLEDALARLGNAVVRARLWDPVTQGYETYDPDDANTAGVLDAVTPGDGLRIDLTGKTLWWPQGTDPPPVVFVDDLDTETALAIADAYQRARSLFIKRLGTPEAAELRAHVYADVDSLHRAYREWGGRDLPDRWCSFNDGSSLHHSASCYGAPESRMGERYFRALVLHMAPRAEVPEPEEGHSRYGPMWLLNGVDAYADAAYRATYGSVPYDRLRTGLIAAARRTALPLSSTASLDGRDAAGGPATTALGFLAIESLAQRAGEAAILGYYRLLPSSASWQEAFEGAFGLSAERFYDAFEVSRFERAPLLPHLADPSDEPAFVFVGEIDPEAQEDMRASLQATREIFSGQFGSKASDFTVYVGSGLEAITPEYLAVRGHENLNLCGDYSHNVIFQVFTCKNRDLVLAHEYVHVLQNKLAEGASWGPAWLTEGVAVYGEALHRAVIGQRLPASEGLELRRSWELARVMLTGDVPMLSSLETVDDAAERGHYRLGFLAADWLAEHAGPEALTDYYRQLPSSEGWEEAFEGAFDLTVGDFYATFEDYWPEIDPLLPHLADDREGPVVVFLGDIEASDRATHESAVEKVVALFSDRFGIESVESTVFVGANVGSLAPIHWMLFERGPDADLCSGWNGPAFLYAASCSDPLGRHFGRLYFGTVREELAPRSALPTADDGYSHWGPQWLYLGTVVHADLLSREAAGIANYEDERTIRVERAQANTTDLRRLEASEGWDAANEVAQSGWALGLLAAERLAELAGDEAIFEYFRLLPSSASWRDAFEGAFGLTVDAFYEDFAVHRADIAPALPQIRGVVLGPDGAPVEGAGLWLRWHSSAGAYIEFARTAADGTFRFAVANGSYRLTLMEHVDGNWITFGQYGGGDGFSTGSITVIEVDGADVSDIVIRLPSSLSKLRPIR